MTEPGVTTRHLIDDAALDSLCREVERRRHHLRRGLRRVPASSPRPPSCSSCRSSWPRPTASSGRRGHRGAVAAKSSSRADAGPSTGAPIRRRAARRRARGGGTRPGVRAAASIPSACTSRRSGRSGSSPPTRRRRWHVASSPVRTPCRDELRDPEEAVVATDNPDFAKRQSTRSALERAQLGRLIRASGNPRSEPAAEVDQIDSLLEVELMKLLPRPVEATPGTPQRDQDRGELPPDHRADRRDRRQLDSSSDTYTRVVDVRSLVDGELANSS